jgi:ABC-type uncharacterized transport system auxiliary subunit
MKNKVLILTSIVFISACSLMSPPERTMYEIDPTTVLPETPAYDLHATTLHIAAPRAVLGLYSDHIQVQAEDGHITAVSNAAWIEAPDKMLGPILIRVFEHSHLFANVVDDYSTADAGYELQTTIERFTLDRSTNGQGNPSSRVEVALRATLIKVPENKLVLSKLISTEENVDGSHMSNVLAAYEKALSHGLSDLVAETNSSLAHSKI